MDLHVNAKEAYENYCTSSDLNELKVGMVVAIDQHNYSNAGSIHGHIGVYVGDGMIMDNVSLNGGGYIRTMPVREWIDFYNEHSLNGNPVKWGWMDSID